MESQNFLLEFIFFYKKKKMLQPNPTQYDPYELGWVQFKNIEVGLKKILEKKKTLKFNLIQTLRIPNY